MKRDWIFYIAKTAFFITAGFFLFGWVVMTLWNNLVPVLFGGPALGFGQALGLFVLARLLLVGFRPWGGRRGAARKPAEKTFASMTSEERADFRAAYAKRCGQWCGETEPDAKAQLPEKEPEKEPQETM